MLSARNDAVGYRIDSRTELQATQAIMNDTRPNIFVIVSHDIGRDLGCYSIPQAGTPHLDRFAAEGIRFDRFYSTSPQCSPASASLFTGRFPHSHGVIGICAPTFDFDLPFERLPGKDSSCDSVADSIIAYLRSRQAFHVRTGL